MNLDEWLTYYKAAIGVGFVIKVEEDGGEYAWFVYDPEGDLIDWWWFYEADQTRPRETIPHNKKPG